MVGRIPPTESFGRQNADTERRDRGILDALRIDGSQFVRLYEKMQALIAGLDATVTALVAALTYTKAQVDSKVAIPGNIAPGSVTASGNVSAAGTVSAGGDMSTPGVGTFNGGIVSADVKARTLAVGYDSVYIDSSNRMGKSPSARRFKTDIAPLTTPPAFIDEMEPVQFRLIGAVEVLGDDAPVEVGFIAEQLDEIGMGQYVTRDEDGTPHGIAYERLTVPLVAAVQALRADVDEIRTMLAQSQ